MPASIPCPKCREFDLFRSHSKNIVERLIKKFLPVKTYRCSNCKWRGWISRRRLHGRPSGARTFLFYVGVIIISLFAALILKRIF